MEKYFPTGDCCRSANPYFTIHGNHVNLYRFRPPCAFVCLLGHALFALICCWYDFWGATSCVYFIQLTIHSLNISLFSFSLFHSFFNTFTPQYIHSSTNSLFRCTAFTILPSFPFSVFRHLGPKQFKVGVSPRSHR